MNFLRIRTVLAFALGVLCISSCRKSNSVSPPVEPTASEVAQPSQSSTSSGVIESPPSPPPPSPPRPGRPQDTLPGQPLAVPDPKELNPLRATDPKEPGSPAVTTQDGAGSLPPSPTLPGQPGLVPDSKDMPPAKKKPSARTSKPGEPSSIVDRMKSGIWERTARVPDPKELDRVRVPKNPGEGTGRQEPR